MEDLESNSMSDRVMFPPLTGFFKAKYEEHKWGTHLYTPVSKSQLKHDIYKKQKGVGVISSSVLFAMTLCFSGPDKFWESKWPLLFFKIFFLFKKHANPTFFEYPRLFIISSQRKWRAGTSYWTHIVRFKL